MRSSTLVQEDACSFAHTKRSTPKPHRQCKLKICGLINDGNIIFTQMNISHI